MTERFTSQFGPLRDGSGVTFRLYAPDVDSVSVVINRSKPQLMNKDDEGWHILRVENVKSNARYHFLINGKLKVPDPASRFQPQGIKGDSALADTDDFPWTDTQWKGRRWEEAVIYELHVGCFSEKGNYKAIIQKLDYLVELGITAIELMPLAEFSGDRGWGYDGVLPFAPKHTYGTRAELKHLINEAHARGLMLFLDVVYNHFGPDGNYLNAYASSFFTGKYKTPWGAAVNFENNSQVRRFFIENALYWLNEFHFDGLRFDAVHAIYDASSPDILNELAQTLRSKLPQERYIHLILENDKNQARYLPYKDGQPQLFNAQWNDDIHHIFHGLLTDDSNGYYSDYAEDRIGRLAHSLAQGFEYQGQPSPHRNGEPRGEESGHLPPQAFISFLQNHDQIGNRAFGERIGKLTAKEKIELLLPIFLLSPHIPMLFMGEEWDASTPFLYFCDFQGELADAVREGRRKEFAHFPEFSDPKKRSQIPDPNAPSSFADSKLNWKEISFKSHKRRFELIKQLLHLRKEYIVPYLKKQLKASSSTRIGDNAFEISWSSPENESLRLRANLSDSPVSFTENILGKVIWGDGSHIVTPWQCQWSVAAI